jgi:hypothetical protein
VPLKTIATFKRMKILTDSLTVIREALASSAALVVSPDGKSVRRRPPLTVGLFRARHRPVACGVVRPLFAAICALVQQPPRVLVENLPEGATPESLFEMFRKCGTVLSVAVLEPGQVLPNRFHGCTPTKVPSPFRAMRRVRLQ